MFPYNITLPANAKYLAFVDTHPFNLNREIIWSFTYSLSGSENAFSTFLTTSSTISGLPGHYLGSSSEKDKIIHIGFDSTGRFALSSVNNSGVPASEIRKNALIIKNRDVVIANLSLSSLNTSFVLASSTPVEQVMRFRFTNANKISIDFKRNHEFVELYSTPIDIIIDPETNVYCGFSYTSPVSSLSSSNSKLFLKNFHVKGSDLPSTTKTNHFIPLTSNTITNFTTISGISAFRLS
jgi:hypothetical protein